MLMYLPNRSSIQNSTGIIAENMSGIVQLIARQPEIFNQFVTFPNTNFPGRTHSDVLLNLIRKKHDPPVEAWIEEGREIHDEAGKETNQELEELWKWAGDWTSERVAQYAQDEALVLFTPEEVEMGIENVRTGLRNNDYGESEDEDEDEEMEDVDTGVTSVSRTELGQVEFGMGEIKKLPAEPGKIIPDVLKFAITGRGVSTGNGNQVQ